MVSAILGPVAQFWLERTPDKREVIGSSPIRPTKILENYIEREEKGFKPVGRADAKA